MTIQNVNPRKRFCVSKYPIQTKAILPLAKKAARDLFSKSANDDLRKAKK